MSNPIINLVLWTGLMFTTETIAMEKTTIIVKRDRTSVLAGISLDTFEQLRLNVGTANKVVLNSKAKIASYIVQMDFAHSHLSHLIQSSAQLVDRYEPGSLLNKQLISVTNFPKRYIGVPSFFLILGVVGVTANEGGTVVLVPSKPVANGARIGLLNSLSTPSLETEAKMPDVNFEKTFAMLDLRVGTVVDIHQKTVDFGALGTMQLALNDYALDKGMQIIRLFNLIGERNKDDNILGVVEHGKKIPVTVETRVINGRFVL